MTTKVIDLDISPQELRERISRFETALDKEFEHGKTVQERKTKNYGVTIPDKGFIELDEVPPQIVPAIASFHTLGVISKLFTDIVIKGEGSESETDNEDGTKEG